MSWLKLAAPSLTHSDQWLLAEDFNLWLLKVRPKKSFGFELTHLMNDWSSSQAFRCSMLFNRRASSDSLNNAWIWRWQMRWSKTVCLPPWDLGMRWWASLWEGEMCRSHKGHTTSLSTCAASSVSFAWICSLLIRPYTFFSQSSKPLVNLKNSTSQKLN